MLPEQDRPSTVSLLTGQRRVPDILECLANLSSDEVFTPPDVANAMLDRLPEAVWSDPTLKWLDPGTDNGIFLREAAKRLMRGLEQAIPNEVERREHIFRNMLYALACSELTALVSRRSVYYSKDASNEHSVVRMPTPEGNILLPPTRHTFKKKRCVECGAPEELERGAGRENYAYAFIHPSTQPLSEVFSMEFDVIIGNPPYQMNDGGQGASAVPLYHLFVEQALSMKPRYVSMITPSRWFAGGKGLDTFRTRMLNERKITHLVDYPIASECFPGVEIKGGVSYFLWDREAKTDTTKVVTMGEGKAVSTAQRQLNEFDVFVRRGEAVAILKKVRSLEEPTLEKQVAARKPFGFSTNFSDFRKKPFEGAVQIYARGVIGWVEPSLITANRGWVGKWKVFTSRGYGAGEGTPHQITGVPLVAQPNSCSTETYLVAGVFDYEAEARNFADYMKTRFFRFLVSLRKNTQDLNQNKFAFVPLLSTDHKWTDADLYKRYGLTKDEIAFIESQVREMP